MDDNKIIIALLILIIAILAVGISVMIMQNPEKQECRIRISCNDTMYAGDIIKIRLEDSNKTPIANETIHIRLANNDDVNEYDISTNEKGTAELKLDNLSEWDCFINCTFNGNDRYLAANACKNFNLEKKVLQSAATDSIDANRPVNDENYKGYNPYHESEITSDGWNPSEHEVSREDLGDGSEKIFYDDGYFRIVDENGYVITYGYGY